MNDAFITCCKTALKNLMANEEVLESEDPYAAFSEGLMSFPAHYCLDDHSSPWCLHEKVLLFIRDC